MSRRDSRRPIEDWERHHLCALGALLLSSRVGLRRSQRETALRAEIGERHLRDLEHGERRTRRSTLTRIAVALVDSGNEIEAKRLYADFQAAAGPALAPESA